MDRREFIKDSTLKGMGLLSLPLLSQPAFLSDPVPMGIVVHSYWTRWNSKIVSQKYPGFTNAMELIEHCASIGAGGVQVGVGGWSADFAKKVREQREKLGLFLEGSITVPSKPEHISEFELDVVRAKEAGATILRTVTSSGRRYEVLNSLEHVNLFQKHAMASLQMAAPILQKHKMKLGIENHKDWRADELAAALKRLSSEWVGVTLDFGNSMALLEDPLKVAETLAPFAVATHAKDMAVEEYENGFLLSEVPLGKGILDLQKMVALCKKYNPSITFNLEMITRDPLEIPCLKKEYWDVFDNVPGSDLAWMLRTVRENKNKTPLARVSKLTPEELLALEEKNIVECLAYSKATLLK